jgi:uncharacterized protein (DUF2147 family)
MRVKLAALVLPVLLLLSALPARSAEPSAVGLWQQVDDETGKSQGWFLISEVNGSYEGIIARMFLQPGEDPNALCDKCRDDRKDMPWLGLPIIRGMKRNGLVYENGTILDPRDGNIYSAKMTLSPDGQTLVVRGYLGISLLGRNQYWKRLPDSAYAELDPSINPKRVQAAPPGPKRKSEPRPKASNTARH